MSVGSVWGDTQVSRGIGMCAWLLTLLLVLCVGRCYGGAADVCVTIVTEPLGAD